MLSHTRDFKDGKWAPAIHAQVVYAMRHARSREELAGLLKKARIDAVFRENEQGRIYGVTFIDHNRREVFNGSRMGKEFSANIYNELFNGGTAYLPQNVPHIPAPNYGSTIRTRRNREAHWNRRQAYSPWKQIRWITGRRPLHAG